MRDPTSVGQPGGRGSYFCTGTSYLRDMAWAPALLGRILPSTCSPMRTCSAQHGHCHLVWLTKAPAATRRLPPL